MSNKKLREIIILASILFSGILVVQLYWLGQAFDQQEEEFHRDVNMALNQVSNEISKFNQIAAPMQNPIRQLAGNYYVVMINGIIDAQLLSLLLQKEFEKRNIKTEYEYGIYDCETNCMVFNEYVSLKPKTVKARNDLQLWDQSDYYFGVFFPTKTGYMVGKMGIWIFSTSLIVIVIGFFSYMIVLVFRQKRLSEIQRDFINNMTHEFRTPISTMSLAAETIKGMEPAVDLRDTIRNYASIIQSESEKLRSQVDQVLHLSMLEKRKDLLTFDEFNLQKLIQNIVEEICLLNPHAKIKIELQFQTQNQLIRGDESHIANMLRTLLDNAIKYSRNDPKISILVKNSSSLVQISITDNGIGIAKKHLRNIFKKFYRVPKGDVHDVKGFGIGLNYVKFIVDSHQGRIKVRSELGVGTTFEIELPL